MSDLLKAYENVTVVSVFPFPINEDKPGIVPRFYHIDAAKDDDIETLVIGPGTMYIDLIDRSEKLKVDISPAVIAQSLLRDFLVAQYLYDEDAHPGLLAISGDMSPVEIKKKFAGEIETSRRKQNNWFRKLILQADDDWAKYRQHRMISELQRIAAKILKVEREWLVNVVPPKSCPACGSSLPNPNVVVCFNCGYVLDETRAKNFKFVNKA